MGNVRLYEEYGSNKLAISVRGASEYDAMFIRKGSDLLKDKLVFEYKENDKVVAKIELLFVISIGNVLRHVKIVGGRAYKKYMKELEQVINDFMDESIEIEFIKFTDEVAKGNSFSAGYRVSNFDSELSYEEEMLVEVLRDVKFEAVFEQQPKNYSTLIYLFEGKLFIKGHISNVNKYIENHRFSNYNPTFIINGKDFYASMGHMMKESV